MHDKLKLLLQKVNLPNEYYDGGYPKGEYGVM